MSTTYEKQIATIRDKAAAAGVSLPPGASEAQLAEAEKSLGEALPEEVRAFYLAHDGGGSDYICEGRELLSLTRIVAEWKIWKELHDGHEFDDHVGRCDVSPGVQNVWWVPSWIPVTYNGGGDHHMVDLAPAEGGAVGQVISFWHADPDRKVEASSFLAWLAAASWGEEDD